MEEHQNINQGQNRVTDKKANERGMEEKSERENSKDKQKQGKSRPEESKLIDLRDQTGVDLGWRVERDQGRTTADSLKFLYENDNHPGAYEVKFEVKDVNDVVGKGVFVTQHVKKGARLWNHKLAKVAKYTTDELKKWFNECPEVAAPILDYGYMWNGDFCLPLDGSKYTNHNKNNTMTNVHTIQELADLRGVPVEAVPLDEFSLEDEYANCDLVPGDEITENYRDYHETPGYLELCRKYNSIPSKELGHVLSIDDEKKE